MWLPEPFLLLQVGCIREPLPSKTFALEKVASRPLDPCFLSGRLLRPELLDSVEELFRDDRLMLSLVEIALEPDQSDIDRVSLACGRWHPGPEPAHQRAAILQGPGS